MKRKPVDKRRLYTTEEKEYILSKTNGKCAHCGKKLTIKTMEKDHSIPWSKGGISDVENIVPLCKECNKKKADIVYEPSKYMKYLRKNYVKEMQAFFERYLQDVEYLSLNTYLGVDEIEFDVNVPMRYGADKFSHVKMKNKYCKALYMDLDEIYRFLLNYNNSYNIVGIYESNIEYDSIEEYVKNLVTEAFLNGCILYSRDRVGNIASVLTVSCVPSIFVDGSTDEKIMHNGKIVTVPALSVYIFIRPDISMKPIYNDVRVWDIDADSSRFAYYILSICEVMRMIASHACEDGRVVLLSQIYSKGDRRVYELLKVFESGMYVSPEYVLDVEEFLVYEMFSRAMYDPKLNQTDDEVNKNFIRGMKFLDNVVKEFKGYKLGYFKCIDNSISIFDYAREIGIEEEDIYKEFFAKGDMEKGGSFIEAGQ